MPRGTTSSDAVTSRCSLAAVARTAEGVRAEAERIIRAKTRLGLPADPAGVHGRPSSAWRDPA